MFLAISFTCAYVFFCATIRNLRVLHLPFTLSLFLFRPSVQQMYRTPSDLWFRRRSQTIHSYVRLANKSSELKITRRKQLEFGIGWRLSRLESVELFDLWKYFRNVRNDYWNTSDIRYSDKCEQKKIENKWAIVNWCSCFRVRVPSTEIDSTSRKIWKTN